MYLSLIGKSIRLNNTFVELNRGLGVARLIFVPEVHVVKAEPLWIALIPLKLVQKGPSGVAFHIHSIPDSCRLTTNKIQYDFWWFCHHLHTIKSFQTWLPCVEHKQIYFWSIKLYNIVLHPIDFHYTDKNGLNILQKIFWNHASLKQHEDE